MIHALHFAGALLGCRLAAQLLTRSAWTVRSPRAAIICWQWIGLALGLSVIGLPLALGLSSYQTGTGTALLRFVADLWRGGPPAEITPARLGLISIGLGVAVALIGATICSLLHTLRIRRRHRDLLALVARDDPAIPGVLVLDHPGATAYCLPGARPQVVVSAGVLNLLDRAELAAVLSHERAHADERHDLVLLPFTALCRLLPRVNWLRAVADTVALLVEMRADDKARRLHSEKPLATALLRFATAGVPGAPAGALGAADRALETRVRRLLTTDRPNRAGRTAALALTTALVCLPISVFLS